MAPLEISRTDLFWTFDPSTFSAGAPSFPAAFRAWPPRLVPRCPVTGLSPRQHPRDSQQPLGVCAALRGSSQTGAVVSRIGGPRSPVFLLCLGLGALSQRKPPCLSRLLARTRAGLLMSGSQGLIFGGCLSCCPLAAASSAGRVLSGIAKRRRRQPAPRVLPLALGSRDSVLGGGALSS